jgi:hypothetical protein
MAKAGITREYVEGLVATAEAQCSKELIEDYRWILDCGQNMGKPRTWVEVVPGLQVMVHPDNTQQVLLFYPRAKHWLDSLWQLSVYAPWWK